MMGLFLKKKYHSKIYTFILLLRMKKVKKCQNQGCVIDPIEMTKIYGSDSLRFTLVIFQRREGI